MIMITLKKIVLRITPKGMLGFILRVAPKGMLDFIYKTTLEKKSFGNNNPEVTFYLIRREPPGAGLFSNYHWVLGHVLYALEEGYTPVVDMENYKTFYNEESEINGTYNAWEYYFNQPTGYSLHNVYKSKNVILANPHHYFADKVPYAFIGSDEQIHFLKTTIDKYLKFNHKTLEYVNDQKSMIFKDRKNILGVKYRGSDYGNGPKKHNIQAGLDETIAKTRELFSEWKMEYIYLSTEEEGAVNKFIDVFGDIVLTTSFDRIVDYKPEMGPIANMGYNKEGDNYQKGLDYIVDTVLLSYCDALIASINNGTIAAIEFNDNQYKYKYIIEKGMY